MNTKKNICFLSNFSKTYFFHAIAQQLAADFPIRVFWVVTNHKLYHFLSQHYSAQQILFINRKNIDKDLSPQGDYKINELIYGDRVLRYEKENGKKWLTNIQQPIYKFIKENRIENVFGEITWAHEILIHRMCMQNEELECKFLNPHVVRLPNNRFAFFEDERQAKITRLEGEQLDHDKILEVKKPDYLKINDKRLKKANSLKGRLDRVRRFFTNENIDKNDPTIVVDAKTRLRTRTQEEMYKETYKLIRRDQFETINEKPYIFIGLHKQPEASVDVFGRYTENQLQNIMDIWRVLPPGWKLIIKEHTNAIGDRDAAFYKKLWSLPDVHFVHEKTDSYRLIKNAKAVITITGTIALEAALMNVPAFTFAPVFFNQLNFCRQLTVQDLGACNSFKDLIAALEALPDNRKEFTNFLLNYSFEGTFSDPISNVSILNPDNIKKISTAFARILQVNYANVVLN